MRSKYYDRYGNYKVWQRPLNKGKGFRFEVRLGNRVLLPTHTSLFAAQQDAKTRNNAFWDEQARVFNEWNNKGES